MGFLIGLTIGLLIGYVYYKGEQELRRQEKEYRQSAVKDAAFWHKLYKQDNKVKVKLALEVDDYKKQVERRNKELAQYGIVDVNEFIIESIHIIKEDLAIMENVYKNDGATPISDSFIATNIANKKKFLETIKPID